MPDAGMRIVVTENVVANTKIWANTKRRALTSWMVRSTNTIKNDAKRRLVWRSGKGAPGGRATGTLARSIQSAVESTPAAITGDVGTGTAYAKYVEGWNSRGEHKAIVRHFVPFSVVPGLADWAARHGIKAYRQVSGRAGVRRLKGTGRLLELGMAGQVYAMKGLMIGGPDFPSPFLLPAFNTKLPSVIADLNKTANV